MDAETNGTPTRPETQPDSASVRETAATAVAPDPVTADLLAKHSAGEKLTSSEYGKLGAWASNLKRKWWDEKFGKAGAAARSAQPGPPPGDAAAVAPVEPAQAPAGGLAPVPIDARLARRTTSVVLERCDRIALRYVGTAARQAGVVGETLARLERSATLSTDDKAVMVDLSPEVCEALGINPRHFPVAIFCGIFLWWATDLWLAVEEVKAMKQAEPKKPEKTEAEQLASTIVNGGDARK